MFFSHFTEPSGMRLIVIMFNLFSYFKYRCWAAKFPEIESDSSLQYSLSKNIRSIWLWHVESLVATYRIYLINQRLSPGLLHWECRIQPLDHQGSPCSISFKLNIIFLNN